MSILYMVATPIGNMEDITLRAIRVLKEVEVVLCEDTRVTQKLLKHYGIDKPLKSFHDYTRESSIEKLVSGYESLAYVSDAGTPGVSDPGSMLVEEARKLGIRVEPIPGASALTALLSVAGMEGTAFTFHGFAPHKKGRETFFKTICESVVTGKSKTTISQIFYESPHRVMKALESIDKCFSQDSINSDKPHNVIIGRELTKMFEDVRVGTASEHITHYMEHPDQLRGEFTILIA